MKANIEKLFLIPTTGQPIDIIGVTSEVNIYQDIFDHYMYCDLVIQDSVGIGRIIAQDVENKYTGGFTGGETIIVQYSSDLNPLMTHVFMVYERSDVTKKDDSTSVYVLNAVSPEAFESFPKKISRAFGGDNGKKISDMVKGVFSEFIETNNIKELFQEVADNFKMTIDKKLFIDKSDSGIHKFIIPNLSVDETLNFMCNECNSQDNIPKFMFYETQGGFNFFNLGTLAQQSPKMTYYFSDFNIDGNKGQRKIITFQIKKGGNILEDSKRGLFKSKTIRLDILRKKKTEKVFDYNKSVSKFKKLQPTQKRGDVSTADVHINMLTTRNGHDADILFRDEAPLPKLVDGFLGERKSYTTELFTNMLNVMVPGTTTLNVGDVVELNFPLRDGLNSETADVKLDRELSGKYIITKLRNKIDDLQNSSSFVTVFDCVKDTEIIGE